MRKKVVLIFIGLIAVLGISGCSSPSKSNVDGKLNVTVSFNAMKEFAKAVGKDKIKITTIIPDGVEPHDFEPKAKDIAEIANADVFIYNGLSMESWAKEAVTSAANKKLAVVEASKGANPISASDSEDADKHGQSDPHIFNSIKGAELEAKNIRDAFIKADPINKDYYNKNYNVFAAELESIYKDYNSKFHAVKNKNFVTGHAAFAYFCRDFDLRQNSVEDVFADGEPSAKRLAQLVDFCRKNNVKTVFVENMVSPAVSKTLAKQVGAKVETIYTFESNEDNLSYVDRMKSNLLKIYKSLK